MEYEDFYKAMDSIREFMKEQDKLNELLQVISQSSTVVCEIGNKFIDVYIKIVEISLGDTNQWVSWFVFENEFGKNRLVLKVNDIPYKICDERQFFDVCILNHTLNIT